MSGSPGESRGGGLREAVRRIAAGVAPRGNWARFAALLVALFVARGILLACVLPPFEGWDEYQHLAYVRFLHFGHRPAVFGETVVGWKYLARVVRYPLPDAVAGQLRNHSAYTYHEYWSPTQPDLPHSENNDVQLYEAQHPSLYYRLAAPVFVLAGGDGNLALTVAVLRLVNLIAGAGALAVFLAWAGRAFVDKADAAAVGLWVSLHPIYLLNVDRVANDALAVLLGTIVIAWGTRWGARIDRVPPDDRIERRRLYGRAAVLGFLLGLAVMAKAINLALAPFLVFCLLAPAVRGRIAWRTAAATAAILALAAAVPSCQYFWFNLQHFGMLVPMAEAVANRKAGHGGWADARPWLRPPVWFWEWWQLWIAKSLWVGGWSFLRNKPLNFVYAALLVPALCGWILAWPLRARRGGSLRLGRPVFRDWADPARIVLLCACVSAALSYHALQSMIFYNGESSTYAWYTAVAIPFFLALACGGTLRWRTRWVRVPLAMAVPVLYAVAEVWGIFQRMIPKYTDEPLGLDALRRLAMLHPRLLGPPMLVASSAAAGVLALVCFAIVLVSQLRLDGSISASSSVGAWDETLVGAEPGGVRSRP